MFREDILQQNWTLIKDDVKKFNASSSQNCMALIDKNNDIWVAGEDSWVLGLNTEVSKSQPTLTKLKDNLKDTDLYNHIDGKVKDYKFSTYKMYILTNEEDKNTLYVSGHYFSYKWDVYSYLGTGEEENCIIPTKLLSNVDEIITEKEETVALVDDSEGKEIWCWGCSDGGNICGQSLSPVKWESATSLIKESEDVDLLGIKYTSCYLGYKKDGEYRLGVSGQNRTGSLNGLGKDAKNQFIDWDSTINGEIISFAFADDRSSVMMVTDDGKCFGFGLKRLLGMGVKNEDVQDTFTNIDLNIEGAKVINISGGNGWYVVTTSDGRVFGTGSNKYGILGRWKGVSRGDSNSRYKTAFEWVECPELEI